MLHCFLGLFGAGRFYKGDGLLGALYIVFFVLACIVADYDEDMAGFLFFVYIVFVYVDCFFIYKGIQKDNWQKLQMLFLSQNSQTQPTQSSTNQAQNAEFTPSAQPNPIPPYQISVKSSNNNALLVFATVAVLIIVVAYFGFKQDPKEQALDEFKSTLDVLEGMGKELQRRYGDK